MHCNHENADLSISDLMTLSDAARKLPRLNGRKIHVSTLWRWCRKGVRGVYLKYGRMGRTIVVSESELSRFFVALAELDQVGQAGPAIIYKRRRRQYIAAARRQAMDDAKAILIRAGILKQ